MQIKFQCMNYERYLEEMETQVLCFFRYLVEFTIVGYLPTQHYWNYNFVDIVFDLHLFLVKSLRRFIESYPIS